MKNYNLSPCPYCGSTEVYLAERRSIISNAYIVYCECGLCGAHGKAFKSDVPADFYEWDNEACRQAVKAWNTRAKGGDEDGGETDVLPEGD